MHKLFIDKGSYDFIYQIPQIMYSMLISSIFNIIVTSLSISEKIILSIKKCRKNIEEEIKKIIKCLKIKFILFFFVIFIFLLAFCYYISCFCLVYKNTQMTLLKDTLISFLFYLVYPFFYY